MARIAIIGAGLAGLCAAHTLTRKRHSLLILESAPRLGGQIHTERHDGYVVELGAEGYVARSEALPKLARELGCEAALAGQVETESLGYRGGQLHVLAPGESASFLGFQVAKSDLGVGIRTHRAGMGALVDAFEQKLRSTAEFRTGAQVERIERRARGYELRTRDGGTVNADRVVLATSAKQAAPLLGPVVGPAGSDLAKVTANSSVNVSLAFPRSAVDHPLNATGCVIATEDQLHGARAVVFASSKFADRAPADHVNLRVFFRPDPGELKMLADATYIARAHEVITKLLGPTGQALRGWVARWPDALPAFDPASKERLDAAFAALKGSGIAVAGSAFHGVGVDGAVRSGLSVDERL
ncbi:MAG: FAD-dependent oxidoreductase [Polyangiales bacterium]